MKEMPFWLASGPDLTGTVTGVGAARAAGRRERRERNVEVFMVVTKKTLRSIAIRCDLKVVVGRDR